MLLLMGKMRRFLAYWSLYERIWLITFCTVAVWITVANGDNLFGFIVFLSGVLCVILVAKGSIINYPVGVLNTIGYAWLAWQNGLYGELGLYLLFFLPMNIVGFFMWRRHMESGIVHMRKLTATAVSFVAIACVVAAGSLGFALSFLDGQNTPYIDAATTALSVTATLLMIRRYRESNGQHTSCLMCCLSLCGHFGWLRAVLKE